MSGGVCGVGILEAVAERPVGRRGGIAVDVGRHARVQPTREPADHVHICACDIEVVHVIQRVLQLVHELRVHQSADGDLGRRRGLRLRSGRGCAQRAQCSGREPATQSCVHGYSSRHGVKSWTSDTRVNCDPRITACSRMCHDLVTELGPAEKQIAEPYEPPLPGIRTSAVQPAPDVDPAPRGVDHQLAASAACSTIGPKSYNSALAAATPAAPSATPAITSPR